MKLRWLFFAITVVIVTGRTARAQSADPHEKAAELFRRGREAMERRDFRGALDLFRASEGLESGRGKQLNIALCEEELGMLATALSHFQAVQPSFANDPTRAAIVQEHVNELGPRVPHLRVVLSEAAPPGTTVKIDDEVLAPSVLGNERAIDPGKHVVTANSPGFPGRLYDLTILESASKSLTVDAGVADPTTKAVSEPPASGGSEEPGATRRTVGFVVGGIGLVGIGVGTVFGIISLSKSSSADAECQFPGGRCSAEGVSLRDDAISAGTASTIAFGGGAVAAAAGLLLVLTAPRSSQPSISMDLGLGTFRLAGRW